MMPELAALKVHPPIAAPAAMLLALARAGTRLRYSSPPTTLYYCIPINNMDDLCGVFGDGESGYEWFVWRDGALMTSNDAYGVAEVALREVLNQVHV